MELMDKHINLVRIHDVIGDSMISYIKESATGLMRRATAGNTVSDYRTSTDYFLPVDERLDDLDQRIGRMIGLNVANGVDEKAYASELLQVASTTFGGQYEPHYDSVMFKSSTHA